MIDTKWKDRTDIPEDVRVHLEWVEYMMHNLEHGPISRAYPSRAISESRYYKKYHTDPRKIAEVGGNNGKEEETGN